MKTRHPGAGRALPPRRPRPARAPGGPGSRLRARACDERGIALIVALMALMLLTALGLALELTTSTETMIGGNYRNGQEALYAADAAIEVAMQDILTVPDWNKILAGQVTSSFIDGPIGSRQLPNGKSLNLAQLLDVANCGKTTTCSIDEMNTLTPDRPWGANNPRFQLYAYGPITSLLPTETVNSNFYVAVMVADDASENDNDPTVDGSTADNPGSGVLTLRAEAFGPGGAHAVIETTIARTSNTEIERGYVGQRGQDEQNRRARKAAVQTPGKSLGRSEMSIGTGGMAVQ
jgi:hypothetical protein